MEDFLGDLLGLLLAVNRIEGSMRDRCRVQSQNEIEKSEEYLTYMKSKMDCGELNQTSAGRQGSIVANIIVIILLPSVLARRVSC